MSYKDFNPRGYVSLDKLWYSCMIKTQDFNPRGYVSLDVSPAATRILLLAISIHEAT